MKIVRIKHGGKIGKFKDDNGYLLDEKGDDFQDKHLKMFWIMKKSMTKIMKTFCHRQMSFKKISKKLRNIKHYWNIYEQLVGKQIVWYKFM